MLFFTGYSEHTIDSKLRLAIPAKYRSLLDAKRDGKAWFSVPYPGGPIRLYTEARFTRLAEMGQESLIPDEDEAELDATLYGSTERLEMDSAGRIMLPRNHLTWAGLTSPDVVIVGARNRLEVYDREKWHASYAERFGRLPTVIARQESKRARRDGGSR